MILKVGSGSVIIVTDPQPCSLEYFYILINQDFFSLILIKNMFFMLPLLFAKVRFSKIEKVEKFLHGK